jgi:cyanophycin synthetase
MEEKVVQTENIAEKFFDVADIKSLDLALVFNAGGQEAHLTFAQLKNLTIGAMQKIDEMGLGAGDVVAFDISSPVVDIVYFIACSAIGVGVYVPSKSHEIEKKIIDILGIKKLLTDEGLCSYGLSVEMIKGLPLEVPDAGHVYNLINYNGDMPWLVRSSSGTTGFPKIFISTHNDGLFRRKRYFEAVSNQGGGFASFTAIRFGAARQRYFYSLCLGRCIFLIAGKCSIRELVAIVNEKKINNLYCVPFHLKILTKLQDEYSISDNNILFPHHPILESSSTLVEGSFSDKVMQTLTKNFVNSYSVSEIGHISSTSDFIHYQGTTSDVGKVVEGVEVKIFDNDKSTEKLSGLGEIGVRFLSRKMDLQYLCEDEKFISGMDGGYFFPGDLGIIREGRLFLAGRSDDMMVFNGINIFPNEIEVAAKVFDSIEDVCAFGLPSDLHYQIPCLAVVPCIGFNKINFMNILNERLGAKSPKLCFTFDKFPRNAMGKIVRKDIINIVINNIKKNKEKII